jgi:hypothetical protein
MLIRRVVRDEVDEHADAAPVRLLEQMVEVVERAEDRIDVAVIGDVVAEIGHRGAIEGREPHRVDAQRRRRSVVQMVEAPRDAAQIAHAVAVRVLKGARVDLVEDALAPPRSAHAPEPSGASGTFPASHFRRES